MRTCTWSYAAAFFLGVFSAPAVHGATTWYVDDDASAGGNGVTWTTAYKYLQDALAAAQAGDEIHVGGGTYIPDQDEAGSVTSGDRTASFQLVSGVELVGGYAGLANTTNPDQRDIEVYQSILSGDLNGDDGPNFANNGENSYHVVSASETDETAILDGFTITAGKADGDSPRNLGAGMYSESSDPTLINCIFIASHAAIAGGGMCNRSSNPTLTNCTFSENRSGGGGSGGNGGGMYNDNSSTPTLIGCTFSGNRGGGGRGGGIYNYTSPTLIDCTFSDNSAWAGGGMYNAGGASPRLTNCTFSGNWSTGGGGGMYNTGDASASLTNCTFSANSARRDGGGMFSNLGSPTLTNCTFSANSALGYGGGMFSAGSATVTDCAFTGNSALSGGGIYSTGRATLSNCTLSANSAIITPGGMYNSNTGTTLVNCILWANRYLGVTDESAQIVYVDADPQSVSHSCIQGLDSFAGNGNIADNPVFLDADGPDGIAGTQDDDLRLFPRSPCIDAGNNEGVTEDSADLDGDGNTAEPVPLDLDGNPRFVDDPCTDDAGNPHPDLPDLDIVDMGAYEYQELLDVDPDEDGVTGCSDNCPLHWNQEQADCDQDGLGDICALALGTSDDCNDNGKPDECDIAEGTSSDQDENGMPDECQSIILVDDDATLGGDGTTWNTPYKYLQDALAVAQAGDRIHVGGGTYTPDQDEGGNVASGDRNATFRLVTGVEVSGGYAGLANTTNPDQRDIEAYQSILSGDLSGDDGPDFANNPENSYHVVSGREVGVNAVLDGLTITAGNADGDWTLALDRGAGMYNTQSTPTLTDCTFTGNSAASSGGGMYNYQANPTVTDCTFTGNSSGSSGGGMYNAWAARPTLTDCTFRANWATSRGGGMQNVGARPTLTNCAFIGNGVSSGAGGGMSNESSITTLANCTFSGNLVDSYSGAGGAIYNMVSHSTLVNCIFIRNTVGSSGSGGAIYTDSGETKLTKCRLVGNSAGFGGGIYNFSHTNPGGVTATDCAFSGNSAVHDGGAMYEYSHGGGGPLTFTNCTFSGNTAGRLGGGISHHGLTLTNSVLWGNSDSGGTNESAQISPASIYTRGINFCCIQGLTGAIPGVGNIGDNPLFADPGGPDGVVGTLDDNLRLLAGSPAIDACDPTYNPGFGATDLDGNPRVLDGDGDGWAIVDMGAYEFPEPPAPDCNGNGVPDVQDLATGTSEDCDENGIPDECDPDNDGDGVIDECDGCPGVDDGVFAPDCAGSIPAVSEWGLVIMTVVLMTAAKIYFGRPHLGPHGSRGWP